MKRYRVRSERVPSSGASVPIELEWKPKDTQRHLLLWMCPPTWNLPKPLIARIYGGFLM